MNSKSDLSGHRVVSSPFLVPQDSISEELVNSVVNGVAQCGWHWCRKAESDLKIAMLPEIRNQPAGLENIEHDLWKSTGGQALFPANVVNSHCSIVVNY